MGQSHSSEFEIQEQIERKRCCDGPRKCCAMSCIPCCTGCASKRWFPHCCVGDYHIYEKLGDHGKHKPSCWPCAATGIYIDLPNTEVSLTEDARRLHRAMKGAGTHDSELIRILCNRSPQQIARIKDIFERDFGNGETLEQWISGDTSGDFERLLLLLVQHQADRDAELVQRAVKGLATDDNELRELLVTRSNIEVQEMSDAYRTKYNKNLRDVIASETSFNYEKILLALLDRSDFIAHRLHHAITHLGTDDDRVIRILTTIPRSNRRMMALLEEFPDEIHTGLEGELEDEFSMPDLQSVQEAYQRHYGKPLLSALCADVSGNYARMCIALLKDPDDAAAEHFHQAIHFEAGTNDELLIEMYASLPNRALQDAAGAYEDKYGRALVDDIKSDTSGDYKKTILSLQMPTPYKVAESLKQAMEDVGTQDNRLIANIAGRSRQDMKEIAYAYKDMYNKTLESRFKSETSFWYRRALVYMLRQGQEEVFYVNPQRLKRYRDL